MKMSISQKIALFMTVLVIITWAATLYREVTEAKPKDEQTPEVTATEGHIVMICRVTAYCPCRLCCGEWASRGCNLAGQRVTASQHVIKPGDKFVAAPKGFAFGIKLDIPGYGDGVLIEDRGGAITGNRLDVFFASHHQALNFGVREDVPVKFYPKERK